MTNELRKALGRNMRYSQMNKQIDGQIQQLQAQVLYNPQARAQINALQQQKAANEQQMRQPLSAQEYADYDEYGQYVGRNDIQQLSQPQVQRQKPVAGANSFSQTVADGINHAAQGASLGWSDEMFGAVGGAGQVMGNAYWRALGHSTGGETISDAWHKGYNEYRDFARQELQDGYQRNPKISGLSEVGGALISPIKPFKARDRVNRFGNIYHSPKDIAVAGPRMAVANGIIGGAGITDNNNPVDYTQNIAFSSTGNLLGNKINLKIHGPNDMYPFRRKMVEGMTNVGAAIANNFIYDWRKQNDEAD